MSHYAVIIGFLLIIQLYDYRIVVSILLVLIICFFCLEKKCQVEKRIVLCIIILDCMKLLRRRKLRGKKQKLMEKKEETEEEKEEIRERKEGRKSEKGGKEEGWRGRAEICLLTCAPAC